ncbi:stage III sporulation protein SpoIIIAB [Peribacillus kribbensis]|uniref:stage III sporulation protein SpoIIIAB n=1 Tax=Peribacillus kribbensis TaxID=356658 RepID=UPI0003F9E887|nr:stage III sporulation protein SpoIIIAB [Peribacillus kribbensis]
MLKLVGAAFIIFATTWTGYGIARGFAERPRQLRQLRSSLQALEAEIMYGQTPLREASMKLSRQLPAPLSLFFETFGHKLESSGTTVKDSWTDSLQEVWKLLSLKRGEYEILSQFGETLGKQDRMNQQKQILLALTHLEREEKEALDRQNKYEKMIKSLGFLSGLLLVVLLM